MGPARPRPRRDFTTPCCRRWRRATCSCSTSETLVLYGVSYGTKLALDYAARHPGRVEALVLDSIVLPSGSDMLQRSTFAAMGRVLAELCAGGACAKISGTPVADLAGQVRRLVRAPLRGRPTDVRGRRRPATMDRRDLLSILLIRLAARSAGLIDLRGRAGTMSREATGEAFFDQVSRRRSARRAAPRLLRAGRGARGPVSGNISGSVRLRIRRYARAAHRR